MTAVPYEEVIAAVLKGTQIKSGSRFQQLEKHVPQAWQFFRATDGEWAAFIIAGDHVSSVDEAGITQAHAHSLKPVLLLRDSAAVKAASVCYRRLKPYLVYEIAGEPCLIPPMNIPRKRSSARKKSPTRIPLTLIDELCREKSFPKELFESLKQLKQKYSELGARRNNDDKEEAILLAFARQTLEGMRLRPEAINATAMIRWIEKAQMGARRDHFFHSFQNYFLGLVAVARLQKEFCAYKDLAKVHWNIDPFHVWFLTVMWHDAGYASQKVDNVLSTMVGADPHDAESLKQEAIARMLALPQAQESLRTCLKSHSSHPWANSTGLRWRNIR